MMSRAGAGPIGFELLPVPDAGKDKFDELKFARKFMRKAPPIKAKMDDWFAYDGKAWRPTPRDRFRSMAIGILPEKHRLARHAKAILDHVEWDKQFGQNEELRSAAMFEGDNVLVNVSNGVLRVSSISVELLPHDPRYGFTGCLAAEWSDDCLSSFRPPLLGRVLDEALGDAEDIRMLQWFSGYILYPDCKQNELFLICYGPGGTGKSTIADAVVSAIADETLVTRLSLAQICTSGPGSYSLPTLQQALVNLGTELDTVEMDESANFKKLVSGEPVVARSIYGKPFTMTTTCKLWFLSNSLPRFKSGTDAEYRRARFLSFTKKPSEKDITLKDRLVEERNLIMGWMIQGLMAILGGVPCPVGGGESRGVLNRFEVANDPVGFFIKKRLAMDPEQEEAKDHIISAFNDFLQDQQFPQKTKEFFFRSLYERCPQINVKRYKSRTPEYWLKGVRLIPEDCE